MQQISVSQLVRYLKRKLDQDPNLQQLMVEGEISNYKHYASGNVYFTLKDEAAAINCVVFRSIVSSFSFEPKDGDKVTVYAKTAIYEPSGQLQLQVLQIQMAGLGELYQRYEALKKKLNAEGKFDPEHKKPVPAAFPERIAVLVGDKSAAMSDIRRAFARRWPLVHTDYYPVLVQGADAPADIIRMLKKVDQMAYDEIILARGGGSYEDLFCFNDEGLVNAIYELETFIVCGIGHEQDFTLADFVCDLRAATPTAAVELITPDINDIRISVDDLDYRLHKSISESLNSRKLNFDHLLNRLLSYQQSLTNRSLQIDHQISSIRKELEHKINEYRNMISNQMNSCALRLNYRLQESRSRYERLNTMLEAYSAQNVLNRGYTMVLQDGKAIKRKELLTDTEFEVRFADGSIWAKERMDDGKGA